MLRRCPCRLEEGVRTPGGGVTDISELLDVGAGT